MEPLLSCFVHIVFTGPLGGLSEPLGKSALVQFAYGRVVADNHGSLHSFVIEATHPEENLPHLKLWLGINQYIVLQLDYDTLQGLTLYSLMKCQSSCDAAMLSEGPKSLRHTGVLQHQGRTRLLK